MQYSGLLPQQQYQEAAAHQRGIPRWNQGTRQGCGVIPLSIDQQYHKLQSWNAPLDNLFLTELTNFSNYAIKSTVAIYN